MHQDTEPENKNVSEISKVRTGREDFKPYHILLLKVMTNEKEGGSGRWQMIDIGFGLC
jgi:hypothetical protein